MFEYREPKVNLQTISLNNIEKVIKALRIYKATPEVELEPYCGRPPIRGHRRVALVSSKDGQHLIDFSHSGRSITFTNYSNSVISPMLNCELTKGMSVRFKHQNRMNLSYSLHDLCDHEAKYMPAINMRAGDLFIGDNYIGTFYAKYEKSHIYEFSKNISKEAFEAFVEENTKSQAFPWCEKTQALADKFGIELPEISAVYKWRE
tara:strand:+ start:10422 stop:11036 length:615 start_codon:yes stop_codon:yes gene_type:complete